MEKLLSQVITKPFLICMIFSLAVLGGILSFLRLPIDAFPDLTNNQVQILTEAPGMGPLEAEQAVTVPIESMMNGLPSVQQVRSMSKFGLSVVTVIFQDGVNIYFARQLVNERLQSARSRLPAGVNPEMGPITTGMGEVYQYVVSGHGYSLTELKTLQDWQIKPQLRSVAGVNEVNTWGGFTQDYEVAVWPDKLAQYGLTLKDVFHALEANNVNFSGGIIAHGPEQYVVRGLGRMNSLEDIGNSLIKKQGAAPIAVRNVASVSYGHAFRQGAITRDGQGEVVTGLVMMLKGENSRDVIQRVKAKMALIRRSLPEGVRIEPFYDQTRLVAQTIQTVQNNLLEGGVLVMAVLLFMLGNLRAALIVAVTIPLSLMFSFMGMKQLGLTANIMSLGALDFGMIVDGSIVMVEDILRKLAHRDAHPPTLTLPHQGEEDFELSATENQFDQFETNITLIQQSVREMTRPIFFGVLIITVVYLPILALEGMEYKMFSPMVFTVGFALLGSLLAALTLTPVLCSLLLKGRIPEKKNRLVEALRQPYARLLQYVLPRPKATVLIAMILFLAAALSLPFLGTEFVPTLDEGDILIEVQNMPGISLAEAVRNSSRIERLLINLPEVRTIVSKTGRPDLATDPMGVYQTDIYVMLKPKSTWRAGLSHNRLNAIMRRRLERNLAGQTFNFTQPIAMRVNELVSGVRADIAIKLFGDDMDVLAAKAREIEQVMRTVPGQTDLQIEKLNGSGQLLIQSDRLKMAMSGVSMDELRETIQTAIGGKSVSEILEGRKRFDLRVKFPAGENTPPDTLRQVLIETDAGLRIPLAQVAVITYSQGLESVNRENGQRRLIIQMNVKDRDMGSFVREGQRKIAQAVRLPAGYYMEWGGQFENQQRAMSRLLLVMPLSLAVIFGLLMATFSSSRYALLVILNVPFALIGGVLALWIRGMYLSVPAAIGFIALFGVAILNGLVLISTMNRLRAEGHSLQDAILEGCQTRLRPVLMTALVAMLGFLPMSMSMGSGAEVQKPLATVVIGGLFTATLLTLIVLPVLYRWMESRQK
jgi:cobalt-zinc-cadmium resistance protein CzcA